MSVEIIQGVANPPCKHCGCTASKKTGFERSGRQRFKCFRCERYYSAPSERDCTPFRGFRIPIAKCVDAMRCLTDGLGVRATGRLAGIDPDTVIRLVRATGFVRRCHSCQSPIPTGTPKYMFCSDRCQVWRTRDYYRRVDRPRRIEKPKDVKAPLYDATAIVLRNISGTHRHETLALSVAQEFSEENAADYLGPCYEAIAGACHLGIYDEGELRKLARDSVKRMWKETRTFAKSLHDIKEACGWEPIE